VALALALQKLVKFGTLKKPPMLDSVSAVSVGIVNGRAVLDLNYEEDSRADVDMNVVLTGAGTFVELQATGEKSSFDDLQLTEMISLARAGITGLRTLQLEAVGGRP
jgi:ribonuclease PH